MSNNFLALILGGVTLIIVGVIVREQRETRRVIMAVKDELQALLDGVSADLDDLGNDVDVLISRLPAAGGLSAEDTTALRASLEALKTRTGTMKDKFDSTMPPTEPPTV